MKKILLFLCCGALLLGALAGCGGGQSTESAAPAQTVSSGEAAGAESAAPEAAAELTYGNDPNNLYQLNDTVCFGNGRVFYINFRNEVASFAMDGSDPKVHGAIGEISQGSSGAIAPNWYEGRVYYMITQYRADYTRYVEIRSMDVETGEETQVAVYDGSDHPAANGMLIIGDDLFYSCYDNGTDLTTVTVQDLVTGESNLVLDRTTAHGGSGHAGFASDGTNLYLYINNGVHMVFKVPMSAIYDSEPPCQQVAAVSMTSTVLTGDGMYTDYTDPSTRESSYVFYAYENSGENWPHETVLDHVDADGDTGSEEGIIRNLIWYSAKWMLGDALAAEAQFNRNLYYAPSVDYTQSVSAGELDFESSAANGNGLHAGTCEDVLYLVLENGDSASFHTLTADGTYQ